MKSFVVAVALLLPGVVRAETPEAQGLAIAQAIRAKASGYGDQVVSIEMKLENGSGQSAVRKIRVSTLERPDEATYSLIVFDSPADVRGTALLSRGEDQWLFLPASEQVRRISTSNRSGAFVGSEFSYEDLTSTAVSAYTWKLLGQQPCGSSTCLTLESKPKDERSGYSRRILWLEASTRRPLKLEYFDRKETLLKTLSYGEWQSYESKFDRAHRWTMQNHQTGKVTSLRFENFKFQNGFSESDFSQAKLKRVR